MGPTCWMSEPDPGAAGGTRDQGRRAGLLGELFRILRIDVLHSHSLLADRPALAAAGEPRIPWLIHPKTHGATFCRER